MLATIRAVMKNVMRLSSATTTDIFSRTAKLYWSSSAYSKTLIGLFYIMVVFISSALRSALSFSWAR
jgi:hypothetical protein